MKTKEPTVDEIKKYNTKELIDFLQQKEDDLKLEEEDLEIVRKQRINGCDFLNIITQKMLEKWGMSGGPAARLAYFSEECKERKLRSFSSYKTQKDLSEVLEKYGIVSGIARIPQFIPRITATQPIDENAPQFELCINDILRRIRNMGPVIDSNEAIRCEYISTILHTAVSLLEDLMITPQSNIIGEENTGRVDYAIKKIISEILEEIICITEGKPFQETLGVCQNLLQCRSACDMNIKMNKKKRKASDAFDSDYEYVYGIVSTGTDWYFTLHSTEGIYSTSRTEYRIPLTENTLKDSTELRKNVKRILEVIVGLLMDRASVSREPATKKHESRLTDDNMFGLVHSIPTSSTLL
ncbi:hypothetical protein RhiirA4_453894 [Rhizophagus irregularis]|uniref:Uncharacterized protein n=1 Tax=Rhizophagus irregularis TaxID=588596 RepID=A0A2I1G1I6_9GLOM|nr:hypothetical protein RhiirA4_453894 [Rhizophagus irregularis]